MQQEITTAQDFLKLLPDSDAVFTSKDAFLAKHLLPLISIDLAQINPEWQGWIHLVNPIEPYECYIGSETAEFHNEFAHENWFILQLDEQSQYHWLADQHYFILENKSHPSYAEVLPHSQAMHEDFRQVKQRFLEQKRVISTSDVNYQNNKPTILLNQLGGDAEYGNWCYPIEEQLKLENIEQDDNCFVHIFDQQQQRYYFIASASGWEYCNHGADNILMFYQPETRRVLFTFDWT